MHPRLYLAGPITGFTHTEAVAWRQHAFSRFRRVGIEAFSPMRFDHGLDSTGTPLADAPNTNIFTTSEGIIARDRADLFRSELAFFNFLGAREVSRGSVVEVGWASAWNKLIVMVIEGANDIRDKREDRVRRNPHDHAFITGQPGVYLVESLDEGIDAAIALIRASGH